MLNRTEPTTSIEEYLQRVARELRALPADARAEELREVETHLRAMIQSRQTENADEEEALAQALKQFGAPCRVGRDLRRAWHRKQPENWVNVALALIIGCWFAGYHEQVSYEFYHRFASQEFFITHPSLSVLLNTFWTGILLASIAGFLMGLVAPKRVGVAIVATMVLVLAVDFFPYYPNSFVNMTQQLLLRCGALWVSLIVGACLGVLRATTSRRVFVRA